MRLALREGLRRGPDDARRRREIGLSDLEVDDRAPLALESERLLEHFHDDERPHRATIDPMRARVAAFRLVSRRIFGSVSCVDFRPRRLRHMIL